MHAGLDPGVHSTLIVIVRLYYKAPIMETQPTPHRPLLLIAGLMNDERVWAPVCAELGEAGPVTVATTWDDSGVAALARRAIERMPPGPFLVAGFSLGGYVAMEICRQAPERVAGLALLGTSAHADTPAQRQARQAMIDAVGAAQDRFGAIAEPFLARVLHPDHLADTALRALLVSMATRVGAEGFVRQQGSAMTRPDSTDTLRRWDRPTLVLCGAEDQVCPPAASVEIARLAPHAELVLVPGSGHMVPLEDPTATAAALRRWMARVADRSDQPRA